MRAALERLLMRYLKRRGWVVFWLDPPRTCGRDLCWLALYEAEERKR